MESLLHALQTRTAAVSIVGLGYVGLPLALRVAECGFAVAGLDNDLVRVAQLMQGTSSILEIPDESIASAIRSGRFTATADSSGLANADVIVICVPTPLKDGAPEMSYIGHAGKSIAAHLRPGQLVVLESTTYPGTTEEFLRGVLEETGLKAGVDFYLGFSPERIDPGNEEHHLVNVPKIVGGFDADSTDLMVAFYGSFVEHVVRVSSPRTAEMAKLLENTYRHVNIALVNEMAILCNDLGIDIWEVIDAAATKPFGFQPFYPGPGWGGHCIPVDPTYLSWRVRQMGCTAKFVDLARDFNESMPTYVFQRLSEALNDSDKSVRGSSILLLGVAYKPDVNDARETPAVEIIQRLQKAGAKVSFHDPYVESLQLKAETMDSCELTEEALATADLVLFHTSHTCYDAQWIASHSQLIFDTRNYFKGVPGHILTL
jgi:UDP-N-acetyl-D-glucosamine dehydrogenase